MWRVVERLRGDGTTIVLVSHFMDEVERLCDRVAVVDAGRVVALGAPAALVEDAGCVTLDEAYLALTGRVPDSDLDEAS